MTAHAQSRPLPGRLPVSTRQAGRALFFALVVALFAAALLLRPGVGPAPVAWVVVSGASMEPALWTGDVVLTRKRDSYAVGDVVAYRVPDGPGAGAIVIHRIDGGSAEEGFLLKGDNKQGRDPWRPGPEHVVGEQAVRIPRVGSVVALIRTPLGMAALAGMLAFVVALGGAPRRDDEAGASA